MKFRFENPVVTMNVSNKVVYYDAFCNLCLGSIEFIRKKEMVKSIDFIPLHLSEFKDDEDPSVVFREGNYIYRKSDAILKIARYLRWPYSLFYYFLVMPRFIRDFVYNLISRNRFKWFGKCDTCHVKI